MVLSADITVGTSDQHLE